MININEDLNKLNNKYFKKNFFKNLSYLEYVKEIIILNN